MNLPKMTTRLGLLTTLVTGAILMVSYYSIAMADPAEHCSQQQACPEKMHEAMHEYMKIRLDKLAQRLEIKASQQAVWGEFSKTVESMADNNTKKPGDDADAATIARYRADRATEFANKFSRIAGATAQLQAGLSEDQRKTFNQTARLLLHREHRAAYSHHRMNCDENEHSWHEQDASLRFLKTGWSGAHQ